MTDQTIKTIQLVLFIGMCLMGSMFIQPFLAALGFILLAILVAFCEDIVREKK